MALSGPACSDQTKLFSPAELLDRCLTLAGAAAAMTVFLKNHFPGLAAIEIFLSSGMGPGLLETPLQVSRDSRVQGVVVTTNDINGPIHGTRMRQLPGFYQIHLTIHE